jgi:hypothetical protein
LPIVKAVAGDLAQAAADYQISPEAAKAAVVYYHEHQAVIDARITLHVA